MPASSKPTPRPTVSIRPAVAADRAAVLDLADRLSAFGPRTRSAKEVSERERRALGDSLALLPGTSALLVAEDEQRGVVGVALLEQRQDYFTGAPHGHLSILAVSADVEGQGVGRSLLAASEKWARDQGFGRITLNVFTDNNRAKDFYDRLGWKPEFETYFRKLT